MITIRGINGDILTHFDNDVPNGNPYFEPVLTDDMESLVSSFSFSVPLELADTEHLVGLNQVLVKDRQGDLRLFVITDVHEVWTTVGGTLQVNCEDISINEMNNIIVNPFNGISFNDTLYKTFEGSGWKLKYGANWEDVDNTTMVLENYDNMRSVIASIVDTYGCQFKFMAQENQFGEITRVAEVYKSRGNDTGKYFYYDRDLLGIERDISHADIKTAIHPYYTGYDGKTYSLKGFAPANPDPDFKKDKASPLIINREASKLFDDGNSYRIMPYKTEVEGNPELVYREAIKELKKYAEPIYTYSVNVLLLQNMIGWEGEDIDLGDTVWMKERVGNRELGLEARVTAYEYHEDDPSKDVVTFSNFKEIDTTDVPELAERIFIAYANSADGIIDFSTTDSVGKAYMGVYTAAVSTQSTDPSTYSWTRIKGEDGASAPTLNLTSSQQVMKFKSDGTPDGDQTVIFTALKQNSTETVTWEAIPYKGDTAQPAITLGGTGDVRSLTSADWNAEWTRVQVTVSMGSLKDIQTIVMVSDGATGASGKAIVGYVTNESTTFAASSDGTVADYGNGDGKFVVYEGTNEVTSGITFARASQVGINLLINDTTGEYKVSNMTTDMAQASVSATYKGVTITKFLSFSKSKQGAKGDKGDQGIAGQKGDDGRTQYTHIAYADNADGGGFSQDPANKNYIGMYVDFEEMDSTDPSKYAWSLIKGAKGDQGVAGAKGEDGRTPYFHTAYINSTDFGTYDYSGNPNLMANINADSFSQGTGALSVVDDGDEVVVTLDPNHKLEIYKIKSQPALIVGKTYTMSVEIMLEDDFTGDPSKIVLRYFRMPQWVPALTTPNTLTTAKGVWQKLTVTAKMTTAIDNAESWYILLYNQDANNSLSGSLRLRHAKLEEGSTATPYQPNLLDDPYWLGKVALVDNIANKAIQFPIKSSEYLLYKANMEEEYVIGQTYTATIKGTKPASQRFVVYNDGVISFGNLTSVEGLTDVWSLTFTPTKIASSAPKEFRIFQYPSSTLGACQIDWVKIEKGDTRTPNIDYYKYLGNYTDFVQADSMNPTKYSWSLIKGADGVDGQDGAPAKALTLQADSPVMKFDTNDVVVAGQVITFTAVKQNIDSNIAWVATPYKGSTAQPAIALKGTGDVRTLEASMWASGVTTIRVEVSADSFRDFVTITKVKDGAKGDKGSDGIAGKDGVGIRSTDITYAGSASGTTPPTTGWQAQVPTVPAGQFLWTKTVWTYTDDSTETGYSAAMMGKDGAKGNDGIAGKDGVGIKTTVIEYAVNTSGVVKPTSGWTSSVPNTPQGQYLWTRTTWTYTDDTTEQGFTVARQGNNGQNGTDGIDAYSAILTNEANTFAANPAGAVTDWSTGNGTFMVYRGTTRLTSGVTYAIASSVYATGTINATTGDYTVTSLGRDNGSITFKATIGSTVLTKTMSLSKARQGVQGVQGTMGIAFYSPTEPTGDNVTEGSTWFKTVSTADDTIAGIYTYKGGNWIKTEVASGALSVEKLSALSADLGDVTAGTVTGIDIIGSGFTNPFDFQDVSGNHLEGSTTIESAQVVIDGVTNRGTLGERKFNTSVNPQFFQTVYRDSSDNILTSMNVSPTGLILNNPVALRTVTVSDNALQILDNTKGTSTWANTNSIGIAQGGSPMKAEMGLGGFSYKDRKNVHIWTGTGDQTNSTPNNARLRFGSYVSYGWGISASDNPFKQVQPYIWQVDREIKFEWIIQVSLQDATSDYVYFKMYFKDTQDTDDSPQAAIHSGRISSANNNSTGVNLRMQNTVFLHGYHKASANQYFSLVTECRSGRNCGNVRILSSAFREMFEE
ncbi:hypothetical protein EH802P2_00048 [Enterococcus phage EH802P2]|nr:hypothetical protein EH802P1_00051 [Enterococcus phage EH802P1]WAX16153.1 hypothetical protein EH802P2_00048 [Enterococcus phage EH802P2]